MNVKNTLQGTLKVFQLCLVFLMADNAAKLCRFTFLLSPPAASSLDWSSCKSPYTVSPVFRPTLVLEAVLGPSLRRTQSANRAT